MSSPSLTYQVHGVDEESEFPRWAGKPHDILDGKEDGGESVDPHDHLDSRIDMVMFVTDGHVKVASRRRRCRVIVQPNTANGPLELGQCAELLVGTHKVKEEKEEKWKMLVKCWIRWMVDSFKCKTFKLERWKTLYVDCI